MDNGIGERRGVDNSSNATSKISLKRPSALILATTSTSNSTSNSTSTVPTSNSSGSIRSISPTNNLPSPPPPSSSSSSSSSSKRAKRLPLHVEAIIHPHCPISFDELSIQIEEFVKGEGQSSFMYKEGTMDLSKASPVIQSSCVEISIVDIPLPSPIYEEVQMSVPVPMSLPEPNENDKEPKEEMNDDNNNNNFNCLSAAGKTLFVQKNNEISTTICSNDVDVGSKCAKTTATTTTTTNTTVTNINTKSKNTLCTNQIQIHTNNASVASWSISNIIIHCYTLSNTPSEPEELDDNDNDEPITVCDVLQLPHQNLHTSWENLIYERTIKENIIGYAESSLLFANKNVSNHIISWNRVLLLHGPPGTGKTSLCRSLSHKLAIRMNHIFPSGGYLLEVKSHSLFSKWFSESGSRISKLFERICEMVEDEPNSLFCVLIDEVESLASSRVSTGGSGGGGGGSEPSDAVRAVNSVLTSLDSIRAYRNVLVLTTTNITGSIDAAFIDRVDLKQYVGYPCLQARYEILRSCINELIRVGIVTVTVSESSICNNELKSFACAAAAALSSKTFSMDGSQSKHHCSFEMSLLQCAEAAEGLSGRSLRKLPFQSHAFFVRSLDALPLRQFLTSLKHGIDREKSSRNDLDI